MALVDVIPKDVEDVAGEVKSIRAFAKFVTNLGAPPFTFIIGSYIVGIGAARHSFSSVMVSSSVVGRSSLENIDFLPAALIGVVGGLLPLLVLVVLKLMDQIDTLDLSSFKERVIGFALASGSAVLLFPLLEELDAPPLYYSFLYAHIVATILLFGLTLFTMKDGWKASVHSGGAACMCFLVLKFISWPIAVWGVFALVLISWSRLYLGRHSLAEVMAGIAIGTVTYASVFSF
ncbi:MAG: hypothetical protein KDD70_11980 [Bdellovibrionales bacterium]|nr:hypothetical protein [Bdellovibrionales bacterium]